MIKKELKRRRIHLNRTNNSNFTIRSLIDDSFSSPQLMIEINSISVNQGGISKHIKLLLQQQINIMLDQIARIVQDHSLNLREAMNFVRSSVLFKEVDEINSNLVNQIVGEYARNKIQDLEAALTQKHKECAKLRQELSQQKDFDQEKLKVKIGSHSKSKNQNSLFSLYSRAKDGSFEEFQSQFRKSELNHPLQLVKVSTFSSFTNKNPKRSSIKQEKMTAIFKILQPFLQGINDRQRNELKEAILSDIQQCPNPCCKWSEGKTRQNILKRPVPSLNINTKNQYQNDSFYTNDKMKQYYRRYYHSAFDVKKISSVLKTKTQEMQTLYKNYKSKQRTTRNFRSKSTV